MYFLMLSVLQFSYLYGFRVDDAALALVGEL